MSGKAGVPKSLVEQILDATFAILEGQDGFDLQTLQRLRELDSTGDMTKKHIIEAIRKGSEKGQ